MVINMDTISFFIYLAVMAGVTYLIRTIPFVLCRREIKNIYMKSFLEYIPYAVLGAMSFPAILYSTGDQLSSVIGTLVAFVLALYGKGLVTVAVCACIGAFAVKLFLYLF